MMREFQIWSQNLNRIIFDLRFGTKTVENWLNRVFYQFSTVFWPKGGSNIIRFEF